MNNVTEGHGRAFALIESESMAVGLVFARVREILNLKDEVRVALYFFRDAWGGLRVQEFDVSSLVITANRATPEDYALLMAIEESLLLHADGETETLLAKIARSRGEPEDPKDPKGDIGWLRYHLEQYVVQRLPTLRTADDVLRP